MAQRSYAHSFSFAGAGWMMVYEFGVATALQKYDIPRNSRFIGTSAGALAATGLAIDADFEAVTDTVVNTHVPVAYASPQGPFRLREYLKEGFSRHGNLHKYTKLNEEPGRVTIVYTSISAAKSRRRTSGFKSADHLMQTLLASCCAPPLAGWPFRLDDEWVIDGGVLDNQPLFEDDPEAKNTVTVSPNYYSNADIKPSQYLPPWWTAFPSSQEDTQWAFELGKADGTRWLVTKGLAPASALDAIAPTKTLQWKTKAGKRLGYRALDAEWSQVAMVLMTVVFSLCVAMGRQVHDHTRLALRHHRSSAYVIGLGTSLVVTLLCL